MQQSGVLNILSSARSSLTQAKSVLGLLQESKEVKFMRRLKTPVSSWRLGLSEPVKKERISQPILDAKRVCLPAQVFVREAC